MVVLSQFQEKYPKLIQQFERTTGRHAIYNNKVTGIFKTWINQQIKYINIKCIDINCPKFGQEFDSKFALKSHNNWHNRKTRPLNMDDDVSKFFLKFLFIHSYFSNNLLFGIYRDNIQPEVDEYKIVRNKLFALARYHLKLGVLEKYNERTYKINKTALKERYPNGEFIGKS